jgi:hypothetical protein
MTWAHPGGRAPSRRRLADRPTIETDSAEGVWRDHKSWRDDVWLSRANPQERRDFEARLGRADLKALQISLDPVAAIRTLLSDGKLHAQGRVERNGRDVLRLVGTTERYVDAGGTFTPETVYEYFTDPETYAPLEIVSTQIVAARPDDPEPAARRERRIIQRWIFQTFERLPLTKNTAFSLRMHVTTSWSGTSSGDRIAASSALSRAPSRARTHHFLPFPAAPASALISSDRFTTSQSRSATYGKDESR